MELTPDDRLLIHAALRDLDSLSLLTVGIDIGTSTSHLLFADVFLAREKSGLSSRFVVRRRSVRWRSPILMTPFLADGSIDAKSLAAFVDRCYADAGIAVADVDSGAVILTGEASKRRNAREIDEVFARESGRFVCATAGHALEAMLAAHGSGAVELSRREGAAAIHVDIGGGTTKIALLDRGAVVAVEAFAVGGRVLVEQPDGSWLGTDGVADVVASAVGLDGVPVAAGAQAQRAKMVHRLADLVVEHVLGHESDSLGRALQLTPTLEQSVRPAYVTFSGGVSEYIYGHETRDYADVAGDLAEAIVERFAARVPIPVMEAGQRIRATAIGASQFTVQVSGTTIDLHDRGSLPLRNVPVVRLRLPVEDVGADEVANEIRRLALLYGLDTDQAMAVFVVWAGAPSHRRLVALARGVVEATNASGGATSPVVVVIDADIAQSMGRILRRELEPHRPMVCLDGIELHELDYVDVGEALEPQGVVPVVVKTLLF